FDVIHYADIARDGYPTDGLPPDIAFFPLLPLMARTLLPLMSAETAVLLISNLTTLIGFGFLYVWCRRLTSHATASMACLLLATFPAAAFFSAGMTEGPFFCCVAMVLYLLQRGNLWTAALVCGIATALRPTGVALALVVAMWSFKPPARWIGVSVLS